jgi:hypothetical protein
LGIEGQVKGLVAGFYAGSAWFGEGSVESLNWSGCFRRTAVAQARFVKGLKLL